MRDVGGSVGDSAGGPDAVRVPELLAVGETIAVGIVLAQRSGPRGPSGLKLLAERIPRTAAPKRLVADPRPALSITDDIRPIRDEVLVALPRRCHGHGGHYYGGQGGGESETG